MKKKLYNMFSSHVELKPSTKGWYRFDDVGKIGLASAVNFSYNVVKHFKTGEKLTATKYLKERLGLSNFKEKLSTYSEKDYRESLPVLKKGKPKITLPSDLFLIFEDAPLAELARAYLKKRNLLEYANENFWGFCTGGEMYGRIVIPFTESGQLVYYTTRTFINQTPKYKNPEFEKSGILYNADALKGERIYLVEGVTDAIAAGSEGVAYLGNTTSAEQLHKIINSPVKQVLIVPDPNFFYKSLAIGVRLAPYKQVYITRCMDRLGVDLGEHGTTNDLKFYKI